jgi:hypothetical protein
VPSVASGKRPPNGSMALPPLMDHLRFLWAVLSALALTTFASGQIESLTGRQIGAGKTAIGSFLGVPAHGTKTQIDGSRGESTGFKMRAIAQDHDPVERQARFRAIPVNELIDGATITSLCIWS